MMTNSEMEQVRQWNEARIMAQCVRHNVPSFLGVFNMTPIKKYTVVHQRKTIRLYLDQTCLGEKAATIKEKISCGETFSIGIMEDENKISYFDVSSVRDLSNEDEGKALFLLRVTCRTLDEVQHICHLHRMTHNKTDMLQ